MIIDEYIYYSYLPYETIKNLQMNVYKFQLRCYLRMYTKNMKRFP